MARDDKQVAIFSAYEDVVPWDPATPEKNLLRALLITAMNDVKKTGQVRRQALEYFLNPEEDYAFSFLSVCAFLGVDPKSILAVTGIRYDYNRDRPRFLS